jgi:hypothetical protein
MSDMLTPVESFSAVIDGTRETFTPGLTRVAADHEIVAGSPHRWRPVADAEGRPVRSVIREAVAIPATTRATKSAPTAEPQYLNTLEDELKIRAEWVAELEADGRRDATRANRAPDAERAFWTGVERMLTPSVTAEQARAQTIHSDGLASIDAAQSAVLRGEREANDSN